jgi:D-alanyl-D-alanine carboxypeptidase
MRILRYNNTKSCIGGLDLLFHHTHIQKLPSSGKQNRKLKAFLCFISIVLSVSIITWTSPVFLVSAQDITSGTSTSSASSSSSGTSSSSTASSSSNEKQTTLLDPTGDDVPEIDGNAYVLYDAQSDTFLVGRNQDTPMSPASITKVMTILLAFENLKMTDTITITRDMYESIPNDYVRLGLVEGEVITVEEAIYACLLISANDACMALAIKMGGSVEGFAKMMNDRAAALGCLHTNFTNPYGLADEKHVTTARDMALMMAAVLKNDMYTKISTTSNYTMPATNKCAKPRNIVNGNRFVSTATYGYENYIGGKTGFTNMSGYTITAGARQNGRTLIAVVLGASSSVVRYSNLISLFKYGFDKYNTSSVDPADFEDIKNQTVDQVTSLIKDAGYDYKITDASVNTNPYCTTIAAKSAVGYTNGIDISQAVIMAGLSKQTLNFPLYRQYSDSSKDNVGTLSITLCDQASTGTSAQADDTENAPKASLSSIIIRGAIIFVLLCILAFCVVIFVMLQKEKKRRGSRRNPRVL